LLEIASEPAVCQLFAGLSNQQLARADEEDESGKRKKNRGLNRFGQAFQEVVEETGARVRIDSFEHSVVEVKKDDVAGFFETLSAKVVVQ
jgi:cell division control protein 45